MKKLLKVSLAIAVIACMFCFIGVRAAGEPTLTLESSATEVKQGETFTVSIKATAEDEINGLTGRLEYDANVLEYEESNIKVSSNFSSVGEFPEIALYTGKAGVKEDTLYTITFKVKATATAGNTTIKLTKSQESSKLFLDTVNGDGLEFQDKSVVVKVNAAEQGTTSEPTQTTPQQAQEITSSKLTSIAITTQPKKTAYKIGEKFDKTGMVVTATYEDGTKKEVTNYTYTPTGELKATDKTIVVTFKDAGVEKTAQVKISVTEDGTQAPQEKIAQTGIADNSLVLLAVIALVIVSYIGVRRYKGI